MSATSGNHEEDVNPFSEFLDGEITMQELQSRLSGRREETPLPDHLDPRLIGTWRNQHLVAGGGLSYIRNTYLVLARDGSFVRTSQAISSATFLDSMGNWAGVSSVDTGVSPGERGRWSAVNGQLRMDYDDNTFTEWGYSVSGESFRCLVSGKTQTWQPA